MECLDTRTGKPKWQADYATDYRDDFGSDEGPRATPTVADGRVFAYGAEGRLSCWQLETGTPLWSVDAVKEFGSSKGFFGRAASPLVEGGLVILMPGGRDGAGVVAFEVATGKVRWKATGDEASYASPTVATVRGRRIIFALTREALVALQPADGKVIFRHPWRPRPSMRRRLRHSLMESWPRHGRIRPRSQLPPMPRWFRARSPRGRRGSGTSRTRRTRTSGHST